MWLLMLFQSSLPHSTPCHCECAWSVAWVSRLERSRVDLRTEQRCSGTWCILRKRDSFISALALKFKTLIHCIEEALRPPPCFSWSDQISRNWRIKGNKNLGWRCYWQWEEQELTPEFLPGKIQICLCPSSAFLPHFSSMSWSLKSCRLFWRWPIQRDPSLWEGSEAKFTCSSLHT